ncbi:hypothetical protein [Dyella amyloliquefaciens]|uniref:hypothetical protein n=1 Tax=Dyella amyloliquefaciens TaxID=1770545 RepID=UPI00102E5D99|nr:hypothetical protein [Dyella amyloliquefaciens]
MANPVYPSTLPPPLADPSTAYAGVNNTIRSSTDAGVAKVRRRYTAVAEPFTCTMKMNSAQWNTLQSFFRDVLQDALPFDWVDWVTGDVATYRFLQRPGRAFVKGSVDRWLVTLQLEMVP